VQSLRTTLSESGRVTTHRGDMELCAVHCTYYEYSTNSGNKCYVDETDIVIVLKSCNYLSYTRQLLLGDS
jgi:hypothetical protein